jgi:uncharacterized protein (TIGR02147 family)
MKEYLTAMIAWHKDSTSGFSIRKEVTRCGGISHTQVSRLGSGKRRLTRDLVEPLSRLLRLNGDERVYLDQWVKCERIEGRRSGATAYNREEETPRRRLRKQTAQNHLLNDWLNVYVKDAVKLNGFSPDPARLFQLLGGIAPPKRMGRSLEFLLREGFLRRTLEGKIVLNETLVTSSDGLPNSKIKSFHKQALAIARRNIDILSVEKRQEAAVVLHLNTESVLELKQLLKEFYARLLEFAEERPDDNEGLYQVLLNFTPISAATKEKQI